MRSSSSWRRVHHAAERRQRCAGLEFPLLQTVDDGKGSMLGAAAAGAAAAADVLQHLCKKPGAR
jgi:hypothetical protein